MTWSECCEALFEARTVSIAFNSAKQWFPEGQINSLQELIAAFQARIPSALIEQQPGEMLAIRTQTPVHPDCVENPAIRLASIHASDLAYFASLLALPKLDVPMKNIEGAAAGRCHCNARHFADANKGYRPVPGWLYRKGYMVEHYFVCHSVVESASEGLMDTSPFPGQSCDERRLMKFIRHPGTSTTFRVLRDRYNSTTLRRATLGEWMEC